MLRRLLQHGHDVVGCDVNEARLREAAADTGAKGVASLEALVDALAPPRAVWTMVPHGTATRETVEELLRRMTAGDVLADGGNSHYEDSLRHAERAAQRGIAFLDVGVSGGVAGLVHGYNLMVGGPQEGFARLEPALAALAPQRGYARVGPSGAGHFVKMIHNGLEYAMLQGIGEAFACLRAGPVPLDLEQIAALWGQGAVVRSWLLELLVRAFAAEGPGLAGVGPRVAESGTGRWTVEYAAAHGVPVPTIAQALWERFASQTDPRFAHQVVAALRHQFGGHAVERR
jgi:6-phosphogluconate dehydrogenase